MDDRFMCKLGEKWIFLIIIWKLASFSGQIVKSSIFFFSFPFEFNLL